jgi:hypothetical protein
MSGKRQGASAKAAPAAASKGNIPQGGNPRFMAPPEPPRHPSSASRVRWKPLISLQSFCWAHVCCACDCGVRLIPWRLRLSAAILNCPCWCILGTKKLPKKNVFMACVPCTTHLHVLKSDCKSVGEFHQEDQRLCEKKKDATIFAFLFAQKRL